MSRSNETLSVVLPVLNPVDGYKIRVYVWDGEDMTNWSIPFSNVEERVAPAIRCIKNGAYFIYTNDPELIEVPQMSTVGEAGRYMTENTVLKNHTCDVEYFHLNGTGQILKIGIAISNLIWLTEM